MKRYGNTGIIAGEDPNTYFKILVEFVIFQPSAGSQVTARVERISTSHIGLLVHDWFNASVHRSKTEPLHSQVAVGDTVLVEITKTNVARRMISLESKLISILWVDVSVLAKHTLYLRLYISANIFTRRKRECNFKTLAYVWLMPVVTFGGTIVELDMIIITVLSLNCYPWTAIYYPQYVVSLQCDPFHNSCHFRIILLLVMFVI